MHDPNGSLRKLSGEAYLKGHAASHYGNEGCIPEAIHIQRIIRAIVTVLFRERVFRQTKYWSKFGVTFFVQAVNFPRFSWVFPLEQIAQKYSLQLPNS